MKNTVWQQWVRRGVVSLIVMQTFAGSVLLVQASLAQQPVVVHSGADGQQASNELLSRSVTIALVKIPLKRAIDSVSRLANVFIQYQASDLQAHMTLVTLNVDHVPLGVVLERLLDGTNLRAIPDGRGNLTLATSPMIVVDSVPELGTIAGRVVDSASGRGLGGATVRITGTKLSAVTTDGGRFTLKNVPVGNQAITVRLFGHRPVTEEVTVAANTVATARMVMVSVPNVLSGVVTTATGQQRKVEVGNDITAINVDSVMKVAPITSVTDLLETRVPGLTVQHSSGIPGAPSRIRLRGVSSITGNNDPIIIVDGIRVYGSQSDVRNANLAPSRSGGGDKSGNIKRDANGNPAGLNGYSAPSPLDQIDPNSIETIEVFKGPSASALYGSDAANGVIVITTKHGRAGPTYWNVALGQGVNWLPGSWPANYYRFGRHLYNATNTFPTQVGTTPTIIDLDTLTTTCSWNDLACTVDSIVPYQALNDPRYSVFNHGTDQTANLTVSGGVPTLQYSVSGSGAGNLGNLKLPPAEQQRYEHFYGKIPHDLVRPDNYTSWGVTGSLTAQPSTHVRAMLQSSLFSSNQQQGSLQQAITQLQGQYINAGLFGFHESGDNPVDTALSVINTPLIANDVEKATSASLTSNNAATLNWQATPWLPLSITGGLNTIQRTDQAYIPFGVNNGGPGTTVVDTMGFYGLGRGTSHNQTLQVNTTIPLFRRHMSLALGGQTYNQTTNDFQVSTNRLAPGVSVPTQFFQCTDTGSVGAIATVCLNGLSSQSTASQSTYGWFVEPRLNFASRFFVAPGFRLDGGSGGTKSTTGGGLGSLSAFPKIDFSYVAIDQSHPRGPLTLFRPRIAFGYAGTQPDPAQKLRLFSPDSSVNLNASTLVPGVTLQSLGNTQLQPETSRELEGGFDVELWRGRISTTWTHYSKTRYNAIIAIPIAPSVLGAVPNQQVNVGEVRNTGTEVTVTMQVLETRMVSWTVGGNLSNNNNLLVKLAPGFVPNKNLGIVAGYPLFGDWARPIVSFIDVNHNGVIESREVLVGDSLGYVGQANPKYQANFNTGLTLFGGRLGVNATFAYTNGMTQNNVAIVTSGAANFIANAPNATLATQAAITAATCDAFGLEGTEEDDFFCRHNTAIGFFQTVNTFRFNDLSINYILPKTISRWFRVPNASLGLQGSNLGLHTNYRGIDPNVNAFSTVSGGDVTADLGQIPEPRTWWLKLTLGN